jgi:hypothetical protein
MGGILVPKEDCALLTPGNTLWIDRNTIDWEIYPLYLFFHTSHSFSYIAIRVTKQ